MHAFKAGQRWISDTEAALGLGIVLGADERFVEISFPAGETTRQYAIRNAPLTRVVFKAGETIHTLDGDAAKVLAVHEQEGLLIYQCLQEDSGRSLLVAELDLDFSLVFSHPQDRLFACQIDKNHAFKMRVATLRHYGRHQQSKALGLLGARVSLLPHQIYIGHEVASRHSPRVLLADEVGLGKTIEAGLILHQQIITGAAERVIIVVPDTLIHQWLVEMLRRFNLRFSVYDGERFDSMTDHDNPFEGEQLVLIGLQELMAHATMAKALLSAPWDLAIIDEAHHLAWSPEHASPQYQFAEALARHSPGLLLLTATPEQLGVASHFARLKLLDPARYHDLEAFIAEEARYAELNDVVSVLLEAGASGKVPAAKNLDKLKPWLDKPQWECLSAACKNKDAEALTRLSDNIIDELLDRHGTGRVLFRNTRAAISGFPRRVLHPAPLPLPDLYRELLARQPQVTAPETLLKASSVGESAETLDENHWTNRDSRVGWLVALLKDLRPAKVLVICASDDTAYQLEEYLRLKSGTRTAAFYRGMSLVNRDRAAAYFADPEYGAQVLVCSEIGSEGRNFQFAQHLVLFDLPAEPDLLEQRIGRLDRIGQQGDVNIHVPYFEGTAQETLLQWYHQGLNAFAETCAIGQAVKEQVDRDLEAALQGDDGARERLLEVSQQLAGELKARLESGRDRLLERNSFRPAAAEATIAAIREAENPEEVSAYMGKVFDFFGVDNEAGGPELTVLHRTDHMLIDDFPILGDEGTTVTYDRTTALSREDVHFLSWEHPMVAGIMDHIINHEYGNTAVCTIKHPQLQAGTWMLEAIFITQVSAPARYQAYRFMPVQTIRLLLDQQGRNIGSKLGHQVINDMAENLDIQTASRLVKQLQSDFRTIITQAQQRAGEFLPTLINKATEQLKAVTVSEMQRLQALQQKNPAIRDDEIEHVRQVASQLADALGQTRLKFDGLRIVICT